MKMISSVLIAAITLSSAVAQAQTADEIINKHIEAIGGKEKVSQVKSLYMESTMEIMGNQAPVVDYLLDGTGFKSETEFNGSKIIQCYTSKGGWAVNPMAGGAGAQSMPDEIYQAGKNSIYAGGGLVDYTAKGSKVELLGQEEGSYKIKVTNGTNESTYFIDAATYNIKKTVTKGEMMGQTVDVTTTYGDYKKTDFGIVLPYSKTVDLGSFSIPYTVTKVEVNKTIDPAIFDMPK
jgi:hypothetical protein